MAKSPNKKSYPSRGKTTSKSGKAVQKSPGLAASKTGGKNLSLYMKNSSFNLNKRPTRLSRRFSLVDSSEESEEKQNASASDSDSSLTAVSDDDEKSSIVFDDTNTSNNRRGKRVGKSVGKGKSMKAFGKKYWKNTPVEEELSGDDDSEEDAFEDAIASDEEEDEDDEDDDSSSSSSSSDDEDIDFIKLQSQRKNKSATPMERTKSGSVPKPKFGRRRSSAALPEDINFKFEFDLKGDDNAIDDSNDDDNGTSELSFVKDTNETNENDFPVLQADEEDIGEEVEIPHIDDNLNMELDLDFNTELIQAPKFNEDDINSDDDYELDDNELLATLQVDNDLEEFNKPEVTTRKNSLVSMDEDEEEREFLKEEEKFLVNEFETNGFDDEYSNPVSGYVSSEADEDDEELEIIDFSFPEENDISTTGKYISQTKKQNDDSDDDSYLWSYFFSSDDESDSSDNKSKKKNKKNGSNKAQDFGDFVAVEIGDQDYDSSESTDIDENVPTISNTSIGSQKAKEVLSSKTADYRPPILGTWVAVDSKPFGIIDGLSTRILTGHPYGAQGRALRPRKSIIGTPHSEDSVLGLDELLNMSELDYDDTDDARIWRDFNNNKKRVPLGAFRNKSILQNANSPDHLAIGYSSLGKPHDFNQRRYSFSNKAKGKKNSNNHIPSKQRRRRASKVEAYSEGYRSTKSGLFSEQALVDVEEVLGDDNDIMSLIKGL